MPLRHARAALTALLLVTMSVSSLGCTRTVDPPPAPPRSMPALEAVPPEPSSGLARVIFETDVPARVTRLTTGSVATGRYRLGMAVRGSVELKEVLCEATPCAVTLPYGDHQLAFDGVAAPGRTSTTTIRVRRPTEVVNHTLGEERGSAGGFLGGFAVVTGVVLIATAVLVADLDEHKGRRSDTPATLGAAGFASILGGGILVGAFPGTRQEGTSTQWSPAPDARVVGGSLGVRF